MMKHTLTAAVLLGASLLSVGSAFAQAPGHRVLVIPFAALNVPESQQWISKGVMETLVTDLGHTPGYVPIAFQGQVVVEDNATAVRLGKQAGSALVVRGATQVVGDTVRLTAQVIDVNTGDTVNTASVTGPASDLLKLEDALSAQLRGVAAPGAAPATAGAPVTATAPAAPVAAAPQAPQIIVISAPPQQQSYPAYPDYPMYASYPAYGSYPYGYGYGGYYPFYGGIISSVVFTDNHFHTQFCNVGQVCNTPVNLHVVSTGPVTGGLAPNIPGSALVPNVHMGPPGAAFGTPRPAPVFPQSSPPPAAPHGAPAAPAGASHGTSFVSARGR